MGEEMVLLATGLSYMSQDIHQKQVTVISHFLHSIVCSMIVDGSYICHVILEETMLYASKVNV